MRFNFLDPKVIMAAVFALIIFVLFLWAIGTLTSYQTEHNIGIDYHDTFGVDNPAIDQYCNTYMTGLKNFVITQTLNNGTVISIPVFGYSYSGTTVIVDHRMLYG